MYKRKICIVTGTRAEYGLLYWLMKEINDDPALSLQIMATGTHLSPEFGLTYKAIEADGFTIAAKVEMLMSSDTPTGIAKSIGLGVIGFADALERLQPDLIVLLGDRYEILAVAQAAMVARIPIAHISGGETTEGAIDEAIRHSITKMSQLHFVAAEPYRQRVIQLGESPSRVFNFGDPGLDNIAKLRLMGRKELEESLNFSLGEKTFLVTYHPVTLSKEDPAEPIKALLQALDYFQDAKIIITKPNADTGGRVIINLIDEYAAKRPDKAYSCSSLGQVKYLSAMKHCTAVVGNSSSGIVEAPAMKKPTVNIGDRQRGRLMADSIINCKEDRDAIVGAINRALDQEFIDIAANVKSLYGMGETSREIKEYLKQVNLDGILMKPFYDLRFTPESQRVML